jgi:hypothetical protein
MNLKLDGAQILIPLNTSAHVKALHLLTDINLANRYNTHIKVVLDVVHRRIQEMLVEIQTAALANPENALHVQPNSEQIFGVLSKGNNIISGRPFIAPVGEANEATYIPPPQLTVGGDGYVYRQIEMTVVVRGDVRINTASGVSTVTIGADPPDNGHTAA